MISRCPNRFHAVLVLLCVVVALAHAIYDPREATTKPPKRRESILPLFPHSKVDSSEDLSRSPKWTDPDSPVSRKPYVIETGTNAWSPWRKERDSELEHRMVFPDDSQRTRNFELDGDLEYGQFEEQETRKHPPGSSAFGDLQENEKIKGKKPKVPGRNDLQTEKWDDQDYYEGIPADSTKPRKEKLHFSTKQKYIVARYDSKSGVQCPQFDSTGQFVYPPDCKFFVNCWKGRAFVQPCAPGTLFNPNTLECDFPHKVQCYGGEVAEFPSNVHLEPSGRREPLMPGHHQVHMQNGRLQEPRCPPHVTGLVAHPSDCTKFLQCVNGGTFIMDCGPGTVFNPAISVCDWPNNVRGCEDALKSEEEITTPLIPPDYEDFGNGRLHHEHQPAKKIACPAFYTGLLPHPDTCTKFLQCANGGTFIMDCGPGTAFNPLISVCDWPYNVPSCKKDKSQNKQPSVVPTTTLRPWPIDPRIWHQSNHTSQDHYRPSYRPYTDRPVSTTIHPETNWDLLRPTWRPSWIAPLWTTPSPPSNQHKEPNTNYGSSDGQQQYHHHHKWHQTPGSRHPEPQWPHNHGTNQDSNYDGRYYHHHHHFHHSNGQPYDSNKNTETQQPAPPYGQTHPQAPSQGTEGGPWHSTPGFQGHHFHPHGIHHDHWHFGDSGQQTQQPPFDKTEDGSPPGQTNPQQPNQRNDGETWGTNVGDHKNPNLHLHGNSNKPPSGPEQRSEDSGQETQQPSFDQTDEQENTSDGKIVFPENSNGGEDNIALNGRGGQELPPDRQNYGRTGEMLPPAGNTNDRRNYTRPVDENLNVQTAQNRTRSIDPLMGYTPNTWNQLGPNRRWNQEEPPFPSYYVPPVEPIDHSKKVRLPTPISGQIVRLRGGSGPHDGYVEVQGMNPGWGIVCDRKNSWTLKEAHVVCKQLGYVRGAEMAWQGRNTRNGVPTWIAANSVSCQGNEAKFQSCKFTHEQQCRVERDAVGVRCVLNRFAHCRKDEIPYEGQCYHLADPESGLNHAEALDYCSRRQSRLIDITSQGENDFISEWLVQTQPEVASIMTSGVGFTTMNRTLWLWEDSSKAKFRFAKWWPGWMEDKKHPPFVGSRPLCVVMKRKFPCHERPDSICVADYFFWDTEDCASSGKGHSYICKRPYNDIGCTYGKGSQYVGTANVTASGKNCLSWGDPEVAQPLSVKVRNREMREKLQTHNYCRNPDSNRESRPWCFTGPRGEREYCDIPPCGNLGSQRSRSTGQCKPKHFECLPGECIPSPWVCDGEEDCTNGADERACVSQMDLFQKHPKQKLEGHDVQKWLNTPLETCAIRCKDADFTCRSFSHTAVGNVCLLSDSNLGMTGSLKPNKQYDYYEMKERSIDCDGMFVCENKKCVNQSQVCNGKNDCNDRSDEKMCTAENLDYDIRLAGSDNKHEGRIEVKILGVWGQVCDDGFGMIDADVICKELGFNLGALEVSPGGYFGNMDPPTTFMVDQLKCRGNESSLRECDFEGWGVHDCQPEEAVGVICKTAVNSCQDGHWKCDQHPLCIPIAFICDTVVDCPDGSDESSKHCDAPFEIRLANGSSPLEGRVEVRHHGIWGTVCDDDFSNATAAVICRSLGYGGHAIAKKDGFFGPGEGPIWLDEVFCYGNETQLYRCEHNHWGQHNCNHDEDAGVICTPGDVNDSKMYWETASHLPETDINDILPANCGRRFKDFNEDEDLIFQKVVQGSVAPKGSYPWQASIRIRGHSRSSHWCGAVVLSPLHVLTAAHCLEGYNKGTYFVRAGDYNTEIEEGTEAEANIEDYYIHEDFRKGHRMNNDIALVLLKGRGIPLGKDVMPICLPSENTEYLAGLNCTVSGFGSIETGKSTHSKDLRYGWIPLLDQSVCRAGHVYGAGAISDGMFCAGYLDEGVDTCDGDSGGPLACLHNGAFTLYGLTSWGQHCGRANKPGVYVRVSHYRQWIDRKIKESLGGR
ncbi:unnamed protein product [Xylocopa violacea]|uniref:Neurotrypsin n=1 Tax=Xylocopa violacea TaxID=135666 RepID=A0ABP1MZ26_XYLVO